MVTDRAAECIRDAAAGLLRLADQVEREAEGAPGVVPDTIPPTQSDRAGMVELFPKWAKAVADSPGVVQVGLGDGTAKGFALDRVVIRGSRVFIEQ